MEGEQQNRRATDNQYGARFNSAINNYIVPFMIATLGFLAIRGINAMDTLAVQSNEMRSEIKLLRAEYITMRANYDKMVEVRGERMTRAEERIDNHEGRIYRLEKSLR